ncbi:hypothetical protein BKA61DRAFT_619697 [Leptodontidium sp. MPI-SDFR-AT-0119]|nr:hypothetical protein BKA61DRAFT_619697 [Leptodontidium sp. MPI-SDFR-AT-0119]
MLAPWDILTGSNMMGVMTQWQYFRVQEVKRQDSCEVGFCPFVYLSFCSCTIGLPHSGKLFILMQHNTFICLSPTPKPARSATPFNAILLRLPAFPKCSSDLSHNPSTSSPIALPPLPTTCLLFLTPYPCQTGAALPTTSAIPTVIVVIVISGLLAVTACIALPIDEGARVVSTLAACAVDFVLVDHFESSV